MNFQELIKKAVKCIMLYLHVEGDVIYPKWMLNDLLKGKRIEVRNARLDDIGNALEDLATILGL